MTIRVFNTLSKTKEELQPLQPGRVGMYLCGPTVYKPSHIGHMVGPVIFDVVKRHLTYSGYKVTWVVNITDVDDKLIVESQKRDLTMKQVAEEMTADYMANLKAMGVDSIDHFPKATDHIDEIIKFTEELIAGGYAYATNKGDVYFDVQKDSEYGKLSGRSLDQMQGEGGEHASVKRSPFDFALWKSAKPGEPSWKSPWGEGRPGWHIECSAMSRKILGKTFDIHGGGLDLQFPHHENEIAQSECCHHAPQAKYWMHNGLMQAADEVGKVGGRATRETAADQASQEAGKIGKSKGAQPFKELLGRVPPETIRYFLLTTQYRRPITYSEELMAEGGVRLESFYRLFQRFQRVTGKNFYDLPIVADRATGDKFDPAGSELLAEVKTIREAFLASMDDDFNTAGAIAELNKLLAAINRSIDAEKLEAPGADAGKKATLEKAVTVFRELAAILGLFRAAPAAPAATASGDDALAGKLVELLISLRAELRKAKNFELADRIRKELTELGVTLEDRPGGTGYEIKKPHMLQRDGASVSG